MIVVFNVLCKGVENRVVPFCKAFRTEGEAEAWVHTVADKRGWKVVSSSGWDETVTVNDHRCEDAGGNSYFFVMYRQEI